VSVGYTNPLPCMFVARLYNHGSNSSTQRLCIVVDFGAGFFGYLAWKSAMAWLAFLRLEGGSQVSSSCEYPFHHTRYWIWFFCFHEFRISLTSYSSSSLMMMAGGGVGHCCCSN